MTSNRRQLISILLAATLPLVTRHVIAEGAPTERHIELFNTHTRETVRIGMSGKVVGGRGGYGGRGNAWSDDNDRARAWGGRGSLSS